MPVSSYGAELFEVFKRGQLEETAIAFNEKDGYKKATTLRHRLHKLRVEMRKENHPLTTIANGVSFSIRDLGEDGGVLIARPVDANYLDAIKAAGITIPDAPEMEEPLPDMPETAEEDRSQLGLDELFGSKKT